MTSRVLLYITILDVDVIKSATLHHFIGCKLSKTYSSEHNFNPELGSDIRVRVEP